MNRKIFILATALAALQLSAGAGIASDSSALPAIRAKAPEPREQVLALFINALLEKDAEKRCLALISVAEKDPDNADTPLQVFRTSFQETAKRDEILKKFNALWARYPDHLLLALHGAVLNDVCGTPAALRLKQLSPLLKKSPQQIVTSSFWRPESVGFLQPVARAMLQEKQYDELISLYKNWSKAPEPYRTTARLLLAECCYTASARLYATGADALAQAAEKCFNDALAAAVNAEKNVTDRKSAENALYYLMKFRPLCKEAPMNFIRSYHARTYSAESNLWLLTTSMECGSIADFDKAVSFISEINPRFDGTEFRFKALLNAGMFAEAEKTLQRLPVKKHFTSRCIFYTEKRDWKGYYNFISKELQSGTPANMEIGLSLLSVAEQLNDESIFRHAEKILAPHLQHPAVANSLGYIAAVLGIDLPRARKLLTEALSKEPGNVAFIDSMAWIAYKEKRYGEAEELIRKALENLPSPCDGIATIFEHAGDIFAVREKSPKRYYSLALKYAPFERTFDTAALKKKIEAYK